MSDDTTQVSVYRPPPEVRVTLPGNDGYVVLSEPQARRLYELLGRALYPSSIPGAV